MLCLCLQPCCEIGAGRCAGGSSMRFIQPYNCFSTEQGCHHCSRRCACATCFVEVKAANVAGACSIALWSLATHCQKNKDTIVAAGTGLVLEVRVADGAGACSIRFVKLYKWLSAEQGCYHCSRCCASAQYIVKVTLASCARASSMFFVETCSWLSADPGCDSGSRRCPPAGCPVEVRPH